MNEEHKQDLRDLIADVGKQIDIETDDTRKEFLYGVYQTANWALTPENFSPPVDFARRIAS